METKLEFTKEQKEAFSLLNGMRKSGSINMFGATRPLATMMEIDTNKAADFLGLWMREYDKIKDL